jgi:hypothetical protein
MATDQLPASGEVRECFYDSPAIRRIFSCGHAKRLTRKHAQDRHARIASRVPHRSNTCDQSRTLAVSLEQADAANVTERYNYIRDTSLVEKDCAAADH